MDDLLDEHNEFSDTFSINQSNVRSPGERFQTPCSLQGLRYSCDEDSEEEDLGLNDL